MIDRNRDAYQSRTISDMLWPIKIAQTTGEVISETSMYNESASLGLSEGTSSPPAATQIQNANTIPDQGQDAMTRRIANISKIAEKPNIAKAAQHSSSLHFIGLQSQGCGVTASITQCAQKSREAWPLKRTGSWTIHAACWYAQIPTHTHFAPVQKDLHGTSSPPATGGVKQSMWRPR
jgi:hypothetical protein